jgi:ribosome recycling factor
VPATVDGVDTTYYDYLINMSLRNLTKERRNDILKEQQDKHDKLQALQKKSPEDLYEDDLQHFEAEYHKVTHGCSSCVFYFVAHRIRTKEEQDSHARDFAFL